jgi:hypothetical protein
MVLARLFLALSRHDFFGGGGMPTESFPLRLGFLLQTALSSVYLWEISVFREVRDTMVLDLDLFASDRLPPRCPGPPHGL